MRPIATIATNAFPDSARSLYWRRMTLPSERCCAFAMLALVASAAVLTAHHGTNVSYFPDQKIVLNGTVTEWAFVNPHPQIYFDVKDDQGRVTHWVSELLPTPLMMKNMKVGWTRTTMKPGDEIVLTCNPPRAVGAKACLAKELTVNGKSWPVAPGGPPPAAGAKQ